MGGGYRVNIAFTVANQLGKMCSTVQRKNEQEKKENEQAPVLQTTPANV